MKKKFFKLHKESGLWVAEDGEVYVPKSGNHPAHYTYGCIDNLGYRRVRYKGKEYLVHRLVAECYIPNPEGKPYIDHIIPVKNGGTNEVSNLRWCTHKENQNNPQSKQNMSEVRKGTHHSEETKRKISDAMKGLHLSPEHKHKIRKAVSKPIKGTNLKTGEVVEFESLTDAYITLNVNIGNISSCLRGKLNTAGGFKWEYRNRSFSTSDSY